MKHVFTNHDLQTADRGQFIDVTDDVVGLVAETGIENGMAHPSERPGIGIEWDEEAIRRLAV